MLLKKRLQRSLGLKLKIRDAPDTSIRLDNPAIFYIRYPVSGNRKGRISGYTGTGKRKHRNELLQVFVTEIKLL